MGAGVVRCHAFSSFEVLYGFLVAINLEICSAAINLGLRQIWAQGQGFVLLLDSIFELVLLIDKNVADQSMGVAITRIVGDFLFELFHGGIPLRKDPVHISKLVMNPWFLGSHVCGFSVF